MGYVTDYPGDLPGTLAVGQRVMVAIGGRRPGVYPGTVEGVTVRGAHAVYRVRLESGRLVQSERVKGA